MPKDSVNGEPKTPKQLYKGSYPVTIILTKVPLSILKSLFPDSGFQIVLFGSTSTDSGSKEVPQNKRKSEHPTDCAGQTGCDWVRVEEAG